MCGRVEDDALSKRVINPLLGRMSRRSRFRDFTLIACLLVLWPSSAPAQNSVLEATVHEIEKTRKWIHVPVNQSVLIETNLPIARQQSLSPAIAEIESISPTQALVKGIAVGRTQVIIWADDQQMTFDVSVEQELGQLEEAIRRVAPHADVQTHSIMSTVVISGTVSDARLADRIMQVAAIFASDVQNH
ncbi:MAG: pilus assembly protein N-terminal domain-containing protein, partial [Planctomycetes bacterium]|nr:pilus assembly protein N-terminal domain-containing protein [Planctomycetota bacterium]